MSRSYKYLFENKLFAEVFKKILIRKQLSFNEKTFLLFVVYLLMKEFSEKNEKELYELAYYIVLRYSLLHNDFSPLLEFTLNNGIFPISNYLLNKENNKTVNDVLLTCYIDDYRNDGRTVLLEEQKNAMDVLVNSENRFKAYIAPTSYGKSDFIISDLLRHNCNKIGLIVPSKALIWQTFSNIKKLNLVDYTILVHDTEFKNEEKFIGVFTQERATRLLQENKTYFDSLYIDEAHNLFSGDQRSVLLARLLKMNGKLNPNQKVTFLSPLVGKPNNLSFDRINNIEQIVIDFNIRDYDVRCFNKNRTTYVYDIYFQKDYVLEEKRFANGFEYIFAHELNKNFIYIDSPKLMEKFAMEFGEKRDLINSDELDEIANIFKKYVGENYYMVDLAKKGVLLLHGKIPDFLKEYILYKFKTCNDIKFIISNSCVFEGVNFPIDNLFIVNGLRLNTNKMKNLVGRINRLNEVFVNEEEAHLDKLICPVHFVWFENYSDMHLLSKRKHLSKKIKDDVKNPLLDNVKTTSKDKEKNEKIKKIEENFLLNFDGNDLTTSLVRNGLYSIYKNLNTSILGISKKLNSSGRVESIEKLFAIINDAFIKDNEFIDNEQFYRRLSKQETIDYYVSYVKYNYHAPFNQKIKKILDSFEERLKPEKSNHLIYIGTSFGEQKLKSSDKLEAYIDLEQISRSQYLRYAVIKSKIEDEFLDYGITPFVKVLKDVNMLDESFYNKFVYGTDDETLINLYKFGLSYQLISFIVENNLVKEFIFKNGKIIPNEKFVEVLNKQDDYIRFEINKFL